MKQNRIAVVLGPVIFVVAVFSYLVLFPRNVFDAKEKAMSGSFEFKTVPGYFLQDDADTDAADFDYVSSTYFSV